MNFNKNLILRFDGETLKARLIKKLLSRYGYWLGGFYTEELRSGGAREGFTLKTTCGARAVLASKKLFSTAAFNKYGINLQTLDGPGVRSLVSARAEGKVFLMDELGPITLSSEKLAVQALAALGSEIPCLVTFRKGAKTFEPAFLKMDNTTVIDLTAPAFPAVESFSGAWLAFWIERLSGR